MAEEEYEEYEETEDKVIHKVIVEYPADTQHHIPAYRYEVHTTNRNEIPYLMDITMYNALVLYRKKIEPLIPKPDEREFYTEKTVVSGSCQMCGESLIGTRAWYHRDKGTYLCRKCYIKRFNDG